jgi:hypothetical protein
MVVNFYVSGVSPDAGPKERPVKLKKKLCHSGVVSYKVSVFSSPRRDVLALVRSALATEQKVGTGWRLCNLGLGQGFPGL